METGTVSLEGASAQYSFLRDGEGNWIQFYYAIVPDKPEHIAEQVDTIEGAERALFDSLGIPQDAVVAKRLFSSDLINHRDALLGYKERSGADFYFSTTEQPPVSAVKLAVLGMCLDNITAKFRDENVFCCDTTSGIRHIFVEHLVDPDPAGTSEEQTERIFAALGAKLALHGATIESNVLRTWLYAPHVDADYPGIVKARKNLFDALNLTQETHYIASTGIQGGTGDPFARVCMDAYAVTGLDQAGIRYIQAPEYLSPTHIYGVTFERATAIRMADVDFLFISGTASIDDKGDVVHPGDVVKQTQRTLVNIAALLTSAGFSEGDLSSFIVYLRDPVDYGFVEPLIGEYAGDLPAVFVAAPVCRPGWLIEIEATAARLAG